MPAKGRRALRVGRPNSNGFIFELAYLPWQKVKFAAQYTLFTKFNGAQSNYDGILLLPWSMPKLRGLQTILMELTFFLLQHMG